MKVLDPGHVYELFCLDGDETQILRFVKRQGEGYPGNVNAHPGTTLQSVIRACLARVRYLQDQVYSPENIAIINNLQDTLLLLEERAAGRHGMAYMANKQYAETASMCRQCGHTLCLHTEKEKV